VVANKDFAEIRRVYVQYAGDYDSLVTPSFERFETEGRVPAAHRKWGLSSQQMEQAVSCQEGNKKGS